MGRRGRRRGREDAASDTRAARAQQMARVSVDAATWTAFRVEALRADRSVAEYLGRLVTREVDRLQRRDSVEESTAE